MEEAKRRARRRLPPPPAGRGRWAQRGPGRLSGGRGAASEEPRSGRRAGSLGGREPDDAAARRELLASWETLRPRSRAPAPSRSPPPRLTHPPGRRSPGLAGAPPLSLYTLPATRVLLPSAGLAPSGPSAGSQALLTAHAGSRGRPLLSALLLPASPTPPPEED